MPDLNGLDALGNAHAAMAYAIVRLPRNGSRMTQAALRRCTEAMEMLDVEYNALLAAPARDLVAAVEALQRAVERLDAVGADLHWRSVDDARRWTDAVNAFSRKAVPLLALLRAAPSREAEE